MTDLPRYRCHKEVGAVKILGVTYISTGAILTCDMLEPSKIIVDLDYMRRHIPHVNGYYVLYRDGYASFSPAKAFEDGYRLIGADDHPVRDRHDQVIAKLDTIERKLDLTAQLLAPTTRPEVLFGDPPGTVSTGGTK